jgi:hypothetical protein
MLSILSCNDKTMLCPTFSSSAPHPKKMTGLTNNHSLNAFTTRFAFPFKVHAMLGAVERAGMESIVSWQPHGNTFRIHKPKEFAEIIVPRYFNQTKYRSFQRQLHIYGFQRVRDKTSPDFGAYHHELFQRGQSQLCFQMARQKIKGISNKKESTAKRGSPSSDSENTPSISSGFFSSTTPSQMTTSRHRTLAFVEGELGSSLCQEDDLITSWPSSFQDGEETSFAGKRFFFADDCIKCCTY